MWDYCKDVRDAAIHFFHTHREEVIFALMKQNGWASSFTTEALDLRNTPAIVATDIWYACMNLYMPMMNHFEEVIYDLEETGRDKFMENPRRCSAILVYDTFIAEHPLASPVGVPQANPEKPG